MEYEPAWKHLRLDLSKLSTIRVKRPVVVEEVLSSTMPPVEGEVDEVIEPTSIQIDYEQNVMHLMSGDEVIMTVPIDQRLVGPMKDAIQSEMEERIAGLGSVLQKRDVVGYRCACHHTKCNARNTVHCNVCGTYNDYPIYEGEENG